MRKGSKARFFNGVVSAVIVVIFLAHAVMGGFSSLTGYTSPLSALVWLGVALIVVHVVASIVTSREQLNDTERPPSPRKKRHLALKWATGIVLAALAAAHVLMPNDSYLATALIVVLAVALAVHLCVGSKSLLKDIGLNARYKLAFRIVVCAVAFAVVVAILISATGLVSFT